MKKRDHQLILVYNSQWGYMPDTGPDGLPEGWSITTDRRRMAEAGAVVFHIPTLRWFERPRKRRGQVWVAWSVESEVNYPQLRDPGFMARFDLTMTHHRGADVWIPYVFPEMEAALRTPPQAKAPEDLVVFMASNLGDQCGRTRYVAELMQHLEVHSYGKCLRNRTLENDQGRPAKMETIRRYHFTLAFENSIAPDYVTEKFFDPLIAGSVPVYRGAPNIEELAPADHCYINAGNFSGPRELAEYLKHLAAHPAEYQSFLAWKQRPLRPSFMKTLELINAPVAVRLCRTLSSLTGSAHDR